jgi:F-box and leucine-rich repeat protein 2/20
VARGTRLGLKELRLSGVDMANDDALAALGKAAPHLEVVDLSYCRSLQNTALEAFVACSVDEKGVGETVLLTSREAGRDPRDSRRYGRRVRFLRHLSLSSCIKLTDTACSNLEFLELAGIGSTLMDDGLVRVLRTAPLIQKLDLEDACNITDAVLEALTPFDAEGSTFKTAEKSLRPGQTLEHLTVSSATNLTNHAFKALIRG